MDTSYLQSKPMFEFTDIELKSFGFDILETISMHEKNLNLIRTELIRRSMSRVIATTDQNNLVNIKK
jgi:hypothetical protein